MKPEPQAENPVQGQTSLPVILDEKERRCSLADLPFTVRKLPSQKHPVWIMDYKMGGCSPMQLAELAMFSKLESIAADVPALVKALREAMMGLERLRDCDWVITPHDRMDAVRQIARETLETCSVLLAPNGADASDKQKESSAILTNAGNKLEKNLEEKET